MDSYNRSDIVGESFREASTSLSMLTMDLEQRYGVGFDSFEACEQFAAEHNIDTLVYSPSQKGFLHVNHRGELLHAIEWQRTYGNILYVEQSNGKKTEKVPWAPHSFMARENAPIVGEIGNGIRPPLYERNFFVPTGYRNPATGCWNVAKPFTTFAEETGADTSFIYELLQHIAGNNYLYLLSWLRRKMLYPTSKTEVVPIFTGIQGTGKSSFGEAICRAMFGEDNVLVTPSFDGTSRFNTDQSDALVICVEEKTQNDKHNATSILKALSTAQTVRKEHKGVDPFYQKSYTEYVLTTNELVPVKFDSRKQRRFMVMETDSQFTRQKKGERETDSSILADEVFTKLYGTDRDGEKVSDPLWKQRDVIKQFKWELFNKKDLPNARDFVETEAFNRCFTIPRTVEMVQIESIIKSLSPFIRSSLLQGKVVEAVNLSPEGYEPNIAKLTEITLCTEGFMYVNKWGGRPRRIAVNRQLIFRDEKDVNLSYASVDKCAYDMADWLLKNYGLVILPSIEPPENGGYTGCISKYKNSPTMWFALKEEMEAPSFTPIPAPAERVKKKLYKVRYAENHIDPDEDGPFEVLNTLKEGMPRKAENVARMDTFLLEADDAPEHILQKENALLDACDGTIDARELYKERLEVQKIEAERLLREGIANRVVYSGAKSLHILVTVRDAPKTYEERRWLDAYLKTTLSKVLNFDMQTSDAARLTRAPIERERITTKTDSNGRIVTIKGVQKLLKQKDALYDLTWRPLYNAWLNTKKTYFELADRKILPSKPIYKEAAIGILDGSYWTDRRWTGKRQETFFVAYRLLRAMGYTFQDVWDNIEVYVQNYKKKNEISYWLTRKTGSLIKSIEEELTAH